MKAGFIGYRNFAAKLHHLFQQSGRVDKFIFFHPEKCLDGLECTNRLAKLYSCDFLVIASPDWSHGEYLRKLKDYDGYIFCEKIPVLSREDLRFLKERSNSKLYFDFNYRRGRLFELLKEHEEQILYIRHQIGNGLALKEEYKNNWRSDPNKAPLGVFQLTGIHFFDLLVFCFGTPESYHILARNVSSYGDSIDNFTINIEFRNGAFANLFYSYTSPYHYKMEIVTTEHLIEYDGEEIVTKGPREKFDSNGRFISPPVVSKEKIDLYSESLEKSVNYFLGIVQDGNIFQETFLETNLLSTELFLDMVDEMKSN